MRVEGDIHRLAEAGSKSVASRRPERREPGQSNEVVGNHRMRLSHGFQLGMD